MIHLLSPAKSLDFTSKIKVLPTSTPVFLEYSDRLVQTLKNKSVEEIQTLMSVSEKLAQLNYERFQNWQGMKQASNNSRQSILAFTGDVYQGLDAPSLEDEDLDYAQKHLRILSGLYGVLRPLDLIEPYRLEMGTSLKVGDAKSLYQFWGDRITRQLNQTVEQQDNKAIINLASNEYFKAINKKQLKAKLIEPQFKDAKNGQYKVIAFYAKKARGMMSRYLITNKIDQIDGLLGFNLGGYRYNSELSSEKKPVFTREENQSS